MISLSAEQKTIEGIFCTTTEQYVIPAYQRPYSWGIDQFYELYRDLVRAFKNGESYFLGNIILARSKSYDINGQSMVVDGQQRIVTLCMLIKMLSLQLPEINSLQSALYVIPWSGSENLPKIHSEIWESADGSSIANCLKYTRETLENRFKEVAVNGIINEPQKDSRVEFALLYFYQQFVVDKSENINLSLFAQFLMKRVTMLPIVQSAEEQTDAENKALTIFETINNRGMDLEDADIFKARLYDSAYEEAQRQEFISMWVDFKSECDALNLSVDDVFRYYSQIIRGRERITSSEKKLRDFFTNEPFSPLKNCTYKEVLEDLNKILGILKYINKERGDSNDVGIWLQIIGAYTNQYPMFAIVVYLFYHNVDTEEEKAKFVVFLQSLVRYCFYMGSTTSVKFTIYNMIRIIANGGEVEAYYQNVTPESFNSLGRLQNAFALLAYHLDTKQPIPVRYTVDKIINLRDWDSLTDEWEGQDIGVICNSIGNLVVLDIPKRYNSVIEKAEYYKNSQSDYVRRVFESGEFSFESWNKRNAHFKKVLAAFFINPDKND